MRESAEGVISLAQNIVVPACAHLGESEDGTSRAETSFSRETTKHVPAIVPEEVKKTLPDKIVQSPGTLSTKKHLRANTNAPL